MKIRSAVLLSVLLSGVPATAFAGPYADDLSKCLVSSTSKEDRIDLVKWMFVAMASHPAVKAIASVPPAQLDAANQSVAKLITQLLTKTCEDQAQKAVQYEGPGTIQMSFQVLGTVAARELFTDPAVVAGMQGLSKYVDEKKLAALLQAKPSTPTPPSPSTSSGATP